MDKVPTTRKDMLVHYVLGTLSLVFTLSVVAVLVVGVVSCCGGGL